MSTKKIKNKNKAREEVLVDMLDVYLHASGGRMPQQLCMDERSYRARVLWWFEPLLPMDGVNVMLIEEELGGQWTLTTRPIPRKITSFGGI